MFKKTKNSLAITLSAAMVASLITVPQVASAATGTQISGADRYQTALKIVQDGWDKSESTVIARGDDLADALSAAPLAYAKGKAPILLTKTDAIPTGVLQELKDLGVKNVYIVGGVGAVSKTVADQLAAQGLTITRVQGADRYATSLAVAKEGFAAAPADVVIANGLAYADALSVSSIAASKGMPILLVNNSKLSAEQSTYIAGKSVYAVGGEGVLNADVVSATKATRLSGADRYATNAAILAKFDFDYSKLYLAKGTPANLVDSLAGSALAAKTNSPIVLVDGTNKLNSKLATVVTDKIKDDTAIVRLGGTVSQAAADAVEALKTATNVGELKVSAVSAINAKAFKVVFSKAVTDVTKVVFTAKRGTTPIVMPATWNAANTEATLTYTANLPADTYTVKVMNGTTDLGTSTVSVTKQKVAKINIIGDTLAVAPVVPSSSTSGAVNLPQQGFISYDVRDQYGVNITDNASLTSAITWNCSVGKAEIKEKGLVTVTSYSNTVLLTQYTSTVLTAINSDSNVSASATLKVSPSQGTLSEIKLNSITNVDGKVLTDGDTFNKFYLDYTALDVSGNSTKSMTLVKNGLLDSAEEAGLQLYSSNPTLVTATVVEDPTNSANAVIEVKTTPGATSIYMDQTIVITAMTKTGKSSPLTVTLKKAASLDQLNISLPSQEIAIGDKNVEIPYEAFDQDGNKLTSYSKIVGSGNITNDGGLTYTKNADGTLKITIKEVLLETTVYQIVTKSGKNSMITVKASKLASPEKLTIDTTAVKQYMQLGAVQTMELDDALFVQDQYGRNIDLSGGSNYVVKATTVGAIGVTGMASDGNKLNIAGLDLGTQTLTFKLYEVKNNVTTDLNISKNMSFTVVADKDIVSFTSDTIDTMYATTIAGYGQDAPDVFGNLSNSALVALKASATKSYSADNNKFVVTSAGAISITALDGGVAEATGNFYTTVNVDGTTSTVSTPLKALSASPVAQSTGISVEKIGTGLSVDGDTVNVTLAAMNSGAGSFTQVLGTSLEKGTTGPVYLYGKDQYGKKVQKLSYMGTSNTTKYSIVNGVLTSNAGAALLNDTFNVSITTANGLTKTVKFVVVAN